MFGIQRICPAIVLFICLIIHFQQDVASLKCRTCDSDDENNFCWTDPNSAPSIECVDSLTTTEASTTTQATGTQSTTTEATGSPTTITQPPTTPTTTTQAPTTPTATTQPPSPPTATTQPPSPPTATTQPPSPPTTTTQAPSPPTTTTQAPSPPTTTTQAPSPPTTITQAAQPPSAKSNETDPTQPRVSKHSISRAANDWTCIKRVSKVGDKKVMTRRCEKESETQCSAKPETVSVCEMCKNEDDCNSASSINSHLILTALPTFVTIIYLSIK